MNARTFFAVLSAAALLLAGCARKQSPDSLRATLTPYPDTSLIAYGISSGTFAEENLTVTLQPTNWNDQIELVAGGSVDIAMATLDEVVSKSKALRATGREIVYFLPAWSFEGTIFIGNLDIQPLAALRKSAPEAEARRQFIAQLKGRIVALPSGGMYDLAFRNFLQSAGAVPTDLDIRNTQLESGLDALNTKEVGLAAAGAIGRPEATRRGLPIALEAADVGAIVLTGFICRRDYYESHKDQLTRFVRAYHKTVARAFADMPAAHAAQMEAYQRAKAKVITIDDYRQVLSAANRFADSAVTERALFLDPQSPRFWENAWKLAEQILEKSGNATAIPEDRRAFVAADLLPDN